MTIGVRRAQQLQWQGSRAVFYSTRIPKFEVLERRRGLAAQAYQVPPTSEFGSIFGEQAHDIAIETSLPLSRMKSVSKTGRNHDSHHPLNRPPIYRSASARFSSFVFLTPSTAPTDSKAIAPFSPSQAAPPRSPSAARTSPPSLSPAA